MNIPKMTQKLVFGWVAYAANFFSSTQPVRALHRASPRDQTRAKQLARFSANMPRLNLEPCACTMVARSRQKICATALPNSQLLSHFRYKFWVLILFASFVALCSFDKADVKKISDKLSAEEKTWMDPFFRGVMLQNQGIYTLCGSKPMTMVRLEPESGSNPAAANKKKIPLENYHLLENWKNWEKVKSKFPLHRFAFFKKVDADDPSLDAIYFADLTKVALVLQENYNIFRKETGLDFDVLDESLLLEQGSEFWDKVFDHPALLGLLLGYGMKNSFCFQWKYGSSELQEKITNALSFRFSDKPQGGKATFNKLSLPIFASFSDGEDEMIEKYRKEREAIRITYEEKDFLLLTLQKLTQVDE